MNISSITFLYLFLPIAVAIYFLIPAKKNLKARNVFLLIISILFYAWGEPVRILLLIILIVCTYLLGLLANGNRRKIKGHVAVTIAVVMNVGVLFFYKYVPLIFKSLNYIPSFELPSLNLSLPLGLSFFCFSSISYVVDVYRTKTQVQKNIINLSLYLSIFFKVIQGPIMQYNQFEKYINERTHSFEKFSEGAVRLIIGLGKKILLATELGIIVSQSFSAENYATLPVMLAWLGAFAYMLQLYFDFSGYSDMAIGLGKIFGFDVPENFEYPYASTSVTEYWQRWHKTLGEWLRDYVYYPLTLGPAIKIRKKMAKKHSREAGKLVVNVFTLGIIWFITSVWHGRSVNYLIWGFINGGISLLELYKKPLKNIKLDKFLGWLYTFLIAFFVKTLTNINGLGKALSYYGAMFGLHGNSFTSDWTSFILKDNFFILIIGTLLCFPIVKIMQNKIYNSNKKVLIVAYQVIYVVTILLILILSLAFVLRSSTTSFLYQQF